MGPVGIITLAVTRPRELRALVTYKIWRDPVNDIKTNPEAGWDRESMQRCWSLLDMTSRSFAAVIKELEGELSRVICIFYLILRGLDTVEDDMTIDIKKKVPLLTDFYKRLEEPGWTFTESGPSEKDRQLLVEFDKVIAEYQRFGQGYKDVISDITAKMGAGMASYAEASSSGPLSVKKWEEYDLYCHFVAGLVGEGLSRLFAESNIEREWLRDQLSLSNHMGLFLQKTNIIRDYAEDCAEGRFFWPQECWGRPGADFKAQADVAQGIVETSPGSKRYKAEGEAGERAMFVLSTMLLDALRHSTKALDYLSLLRNQSVFNFCAIPQVMAIATLNLMMSNPDVFKRNVKIRKSQAVQLILRAVNPRDVSYEFLRFAREMRTKVSPKDPNFVKWSLELSKIEVWCETYYPSYVNAQTEGYLDPRANMMAKYSKDRRDLAQAQGVATGAIQPKRATDSYETRRSLMTKEERAAEDTKERGEMMQFFIIIMIALCSVMLLTALVGWMVAWYYVSDEQDPLSLYVMTKYREIMGATPTYYESLVANSRHGLQMIRKKIEL